MQISGFLAGRTEVSTSPSNFDLLDHRIVALFTFLPLLSINFQVILIIATLMITAEGPESSSLILNCTINDSLSMGNNRLNLVSCEFGNLFFRMHSGSEEDFIGVDVPNPANKFLVKDNHFGHAFFGLNDIFEVFEIELVRVVDLGSELSNGLMLELFASFDHDHRTEFPDIRVNEF